MTHIADMTCELRDVQFAAPDPVTVALQPLLAKTEYVERLHELEPESELHRHVALLLRAVYQDCLWAAGR
jgi:hypothetical protein